MSSDMAGVLIGVLAAVCAVAAIPDKSLARRCVFSTALILALWLAGK